MARQMIYRYTVAGFGEFPIDMLRYDRAWPVSEVQSGNLYRTFNTPLNERASGTWLVDIEGLNPPTVARWESFMCRIGAVAKRPF